MPKNSPISNCDGGVSVSEGLILQEFLQENHIYRRVDEGGPAPPCGKSRHGGSSHYDNAAIACHLEGYPFHSLPRFGGLREVV